MARKTLGDVSLEIYTSVAQSSNNEKRLKSSTFWKLYDVKHRTQSAVDNVKDSLDKQGLRIFVKSGVLLGREKKHKDWIVLSLKIPPELPHPPKVDIIFPSRDWFAMIKNRDFESEREVEAFFICPLLEMLGYSYDDIVIGYPLKMFKGVKATRTEADFAIFNGSSRVNTPPPKRRWPRSTTKVGGSG